MPSGPVDAPSGASFRRRHGARRRDIQGLRAVAVILVVAFHGGVDVPGGFRGVDVFFAISGFVITGMILSELLETGRFSLRAFYLRRAKRLLPALALMVSIVSLVAIIGVSLAVQHEAGLTGTFASLFGANVYLESTPGGYFALAANLNPFLHTWTLGVEEQFYVLFPSLLAVCWWIGRRPRYGRVLAFAAVVAAGLCSIAVAHHVELSRYRFVFYSSPARAWEFAAGAALALVLPSMRRVSVPIGIAVAAAGVAAIAVAATSASVEISLAENGLAVAGTCALLAAGAMAATNPVSRALAVKPLVWIGDRSYSWYLWHWPLIVMAKAVWPNAGWTSGAFALGSLVPATLAYRFVEDPIRRRRLAQRRMLAIAAVCVVVPVAASLCLTEAGRVLTRTAAVDALVHSETEPACLLGPAKTETGCRELSTSRGVVALVGDSNAGMLMFPVARAAAKAGLSAAVMEYPACPFVDLRRIRYGFAFDNQTCSDYYDTTLAWILRSKPKLVIIAARTDTYITTSEFALGQRHGGHLTSDPKAKAKLWAAGLTQTLHDLHAAGIRALLVHPAPLMPYATVSCAAIRVLVDACAQPVSRKTVQEHLASSVAAEDNAASRTHTPTLNLVAALCAARSCPGRRGSTYLYSNETHLGPAGALTLTPLFYRVVERIVHNGGP